MSIYTRTGDNGTTGLYGGKRISKADCQIETYGSIDELTSFIGLAASKIKNKKDKDFLILIQKDLYKIMAYLSGADVSFGFLEGRILIFESKIDEVERKLPPLNKFIIPGGTEVSSWFHIVRTICRRAERNVVQLKTESRLNREKIIKYLNRLSDLFFIMARFYNKEKEEVVV